MFEFPIAWYFGCLPTSEPPVSSVVQATFVAGVSVEPRKRPDLCPESSWPIPSLSCRVPFQRFDESTDVRFYFNLAHFERRDFFRVLSNRRQAATR